ncbi:lpg1661 family Dot/Icm T4SS effector [Rhabdobacter roseus]|uniref:Putative acyltransferase n=1 Tax=Rhabdobacter roseus TaxID=1655419 RepID=A0A840TMW5_9BACT|nr:heparan-alpha-glucosaminide N-acetyltransferase domain-containing protein [Rhabdobacter roseus]MBB5282882.1 putative acyltransferase [Rhabdobacter roseus]
MKLPSERLFSLDLLRGFTMAAMIVVNFPGSDAHVYHPLSHSRWNGLSFTDLIAPFFLFIVGVSIALAYTKRLGTGTPKSGLYGKIVVRALKIFAIGMFLNLLPDFDFTDLRWTGTLHRIAIVFLVCALLFLHTSWKAQAWIGGLTLVLYWLAMTQIPTPGLGRVALEPGQNLAAWVDSKYLPGKMWQGTWDPEGILSTFPSIVTGITGMLAGRLMLTGFTRNEKTNYLMTAGLLSAVAGYFWGLHFPVNENLWTSSFVLVTSGLAALLLGAVYFLVDIQGRTKGTSVGLIFGANAITVYVLADVLALIFYGWRVQGSSLNEHFVSTFTQAGLAPELAGLLYSLLFVGVNFIPAWWLYRNKIFIKL